MTFIGLACFLAAFAATAGPLPPPLRDEEPLPWPRAPELARRPVELLPQLKVSLPMCEGSQGRERCRTLGPALGGELAALHRPSPYFAFGAAASYSVASGSVAPRQELAEKTLTLGLTLRVYLVEAGALDPYLEALIGWGSQTTTLVADGGPHGTDSRLGPVGRAGGGVDFLVSPRVKVGVTAGFSELVLEGGARYQGSIVGGLELALLLGDSL